MRSAVGALPRELKVVRFGDNMRRLPARRTGGSQIKLGWQVNTRPVGDLVSQIDRVPDQDVDDLLDEYKRTYTATDNQVVRYQPGWK